MSKKLKKAQKKSMSPKVKSVLANSFKGIISNQACIDNGSEAPWWLAVLFFLFAIIIPLIPTYVSLDKTYGSSFVSTSNYNLDTELTRATFQMAKDGKTFLIEKNLLTYSDYVEPFDDTTPIYERVNPITNEYAFRVYFTTRRGNKLQKYIDGKGDGLTKVQYQKGSTSVYDPELDVDKKGSYIPSFMVITPRTMAVGLYKASSTKLVANTYGGLDWSHSNSKDGVDLLERIIKKAGLTKGDLNTLDLDHLSNEVVSKAFAGWKAVFTETYLTQKDKTKWNTTLIYLGVYAGLLVFLGLLIFILTRGRNNPFNTLNFWVCQKIAYFLAFTPAVIALVFGFIMAGNTLGTMAFIMLLSLRTMWASMRQLRPLQ